MLKAIYKPTGEVVWAFRLENDATWLGKQEERDNWVAPRYMVYDYNEKGDIKVFFTKTHIRDGSQVRCHFKHESNREIYDKESESKEHQMAKEGVYEAICNGLIKIDGINLKDLLIDIQFEYPLSNSKKSKIADVITIFKEWHPVYGKGIIFEVQLSHQISEITEDRTFNRIVEGYSVCWLWDGDFDKNNKIKNDKNRITIVPFSKAIEEYQKIIENKSINKINEAGILLDKKITEYKLMINKNEEIKKDLIENTNYFIGSLNEVYKSYLNKMKNELSASLNSNSISIINNTIDELKQFLNKKVLDSKDYFLKELSNKLYDKEELKNILKIKIEEIFDKEFHTLIIEKFNDKQIKDIDIENMLHKVVLEKITFKPHQVFEGQGIIV